MRCCRIYSPSWPTLMSLRYPEDGGFDYFEGGVAMEGMPEGVTSADTAFINSDGGSGDHHDEDSFITPLAVRPDGVFLVLSRFQSLFICV